MRTIDAGIERELSQLTNAEVLQAQLRTLQVKADDRARRLRDQGLEIDRQRREIEALKKDVAVLETLFLETFAAGRGGRQSLLPPEHLRLHVGTSTSAANFWRQGRNSARRVIEVFGTHPGGPVLDWGCGAGRTLNWLLREGSWSEHWHGADVDREAIEWLRLQGFERVTVCGDLPPLPYPNDYLQGLYAFSVLTHIHPNRHRQWYEEIRRVLRPGGRAYLTVQGECIVQSGRVNDVAALEHYSSNGWCHIENDGHYKNADLVSPDFTQSLIADLFIINDYRITGYQNMDGFIVTKPT